MDCSKWHARWLLQLDCNLTLSQRADGRDVRYLTVREPSSKTDLARKVGREEGNVLRAALAGFESLGRHLCTRISPRDEKTALTCRGALQVITSWSSITTSRHHLSIQGTTEGESHLPSATMWERLSATYRFECREEPTLHDNALLPGGLLPNHIVSSSRKNLTSLTSLGVYMLGLSPPLRRLCAPKTGCAGLWPFNS